MDKSHLLMDDDNSNMSIATPATSNSSSSSSSESEKKSDASPDSNAAAAAAAASSEEGENEEDECCICLEPIRLAITVECGHKFCYLCIKGFQLRQYVEVTCPLCRHKIDVRTIANASMDKEEFERRHKLQLAAFQWEYSGRNGWWLFDDQTNSVLEGHYREFLRDKLGVTMHAKVAGAVAKATATIAAVAAGAGLGLGAVAVRQSLARKAKKPRIAADGSGDDDEDEDDEEDSDEEEDATKPAQFTVQIGSSAYLIDFNSMQQINQLQPTKRRNLRRQKVEETMKDDAVKGQAGLHFRKSPKSNSGPAGGGGSGSLSASPVHSPSATHPRSPVAHKIAPAAAAAGTFPSLVPGNKSEPHQMILPAIANQPDVDNQMLNLFMMASGDDNNGQSSQHPSAPSSPPHHADE